MASDLSESVICPKCGSTRVTPQPRTAPESKLQWYQCTLCHAIWFVEPVAGQAG